MSDEKALARAPEQAAGAGVNGSGTNVPPPTYMTGFDGMATAPFPEKVQAVLNKPINPDDVEIKPDGIVFLPGAWWRGRLFEAFGPGGWALAPRQPARVMGDLMIYPGALYCLGRFVGEATGECFYRANNPNMSYASCLEGAKTDALTRCAKDIVPAALCLWDQQWREAWLEKYAAKEWDPKAKRGEGGWKWRRKNQKALVEAIDLMAGAGGVAPAASGQSSTSSETTPPAQSTDSAVSAIPASPSDITAPEETKRKFAQDAVVLQFKRLGIKKGAARTWLKQVFGVDSWEGLSSEQGYHAHSLLETLNPGDLGGDRIMSEEYMQMLDNLKSNGKALG